MKSNFIFFGLLTLAAQGAFSETKAPVSKPEKPSFFTTEEHCVAYKAIKRMALIHKSDVIGKNCEVDAQVLPDTGGKYYIQVTLPANKFVTDEPERDRDVVKILRYDKAPNLIFRSDDLQRAEWQKLVTEDSFEAKGRLAVAGSEHPVVATLSLEKSQEGRLVVGVVKTKFTHLGLKPPKLFAGVGAQVEDKLELLFHLQLNKVLGARALLPNKN